MRRLLGDTPSTDLNVRGRWKGLSRNSFDSKLRLRSSNRLIGTVRGRCRGHMRGRARIADFHLHLLRTASTQAGAISGSCCVNFCSKKSYILVARTLCTLKDAAAYAENKVGAALCVSARHRRALICSGIWLRGRLCGSFIASSAEYRWSLPQVTGHGRAVRTIPCFCGQSQIPAVERSESNSVFEDVCFRLDLIGTKLGID